MEHCKLSNFENQISGFQVSGVRCQGKKSLKPEHWNLKPSQKLATCTDKAIELRSSPKKQVFDFRLSECYSGPPFPCSRISISTTPSSSWKENITFKTNTRVRTIALTHRIVTAEIIPHLRARLCWFAYLVCAEVVPISSQFKKCINNKELMIPSWESHLVKSPDLAKKPVPTGQKIKSEFEMVSVALRGTKWAFNFDWSSNYRTWVSSSISLWKFAALVEVS